jgi:D-glycero-D-manno-heptose 1,7-bisphosphate phosphatase
MRKAVFLDRDGVLNRVICRDGRPYPPASLAEFEILEGVPEACQMLRDAGYLLIVVTNQPDVARGTTSRDSVDLFHSTLRNQVALDAIFTCYHDDRDSCDCRKPKPGLFRDAALQYGIDLTISYMVGDRWRDIEAGQSAGCRTVFLDYQYREKQPAKPPDFTASSLLEATRWILLRDSEQKQSFVGEK